VEFQFSNSTSLLCSVSAAEKLLLALSFGHGFNLCIMLNDGIMNEGQGDLSGLLLLLEKKKNMLRKLL
jgi:hypothetical protein